MPSDFWAGYIIAITGVSFIALVWFVANVYFSSGDDSDVEHQVWDHDLKEGTAPAPIWWFWLIFALMVVSVIYLMLYPGLGNYGGVLKWSQGGEVAASRVAYAADFGAQRERIAAADIAALAADPAMVAAGARIYTVHCAACHGRDATGQALLFPNLTDAHWQWGATPDSIAQSIRAGRTAVMPPLLAALGEESVTALTNYVLALNDGNADAPVHDAARTQFGALCGACHGADGSGNPLLGAPSLTVGAWTYGGEFEQIYQSIAEGRSGQMPAFAGKLDDTEVRLLSAWLLAEPGSSD
jgi:cytochrome c oxidase cbb3-type subunit 3